MARDDYHVVVYQILSYLYVQLKKGAEIEVEKLQSESLFDINEKYREYIFINLINDGLVTNVKVVERAYLGCEKEIEFLNFENIQITPKGIEYLSDNSFYDPLCLRRCRFSSVAKALLKGVSFNFKYR